MKELIINESILYKDLENKEIDESALEKYWNKIFDKLPDNLKEEAKAKKFKIDQQAKDPIAEYFKITIPDASKSLKNAIESLTPMVICMKD